MYNFAIIFIFLVISSNTLADSQRSRIQSQSVIDHTSEICEPDYEQQQLDRDYRSYNDEHYRRDGFLANKWLDDPEYTGDRSDERLGELPAERAVSIGRSGHRKSQGKNRIVILDVSAQSGRPYWRPERLAQHEPVYYFPPVRPAMIGPVVTKPVATVSNTNANANVNRVGGRKKSVENRLTKDKYHDENYAMTDTSDYPDHQLLRMHKKINQDSIYSRSGKYDPPAYVEYRMDTLPSEIASNVNSNINTNSIANRNIVNDDDDDERGRRENVSSTLKEAGNDDKTTNGDTSVHSIVPQDVKELSKITKSDKKIKKKSHKQRLNKISLGQRKKTNSPPVSESSIDVTTTSILRSDDSKKVLLTDDDRIVADIDKINKPIPSNEKDRESGKVPRNIQESTSDVSDDKNDGGTEKSVSLDDKMTDGGWKSLDGQMKDAVGKDQVFLTEISSPSVNNERNLNSNDNSIETRPTARSDAPPAPISLDSRGNKGVGSPGEIMDLKYRRSNSHRPKNSRSRGNSNVNGNVNSNVNVNQARPELRQLPEVSNSEKTGAKMSGIFEYRAMGKSLEHNKNSNINSNVNVNSVGEEKKLVGDVSRLVQHPTNKRPIEIGNYVDNDGNDNDDRILAQRNMDSANLNRNINTNTNVNHNSVDSIIDGNNRRSLPYKPNLSKRATNGESVGHGLNKFRQRHARPYDSERVSHDNDDDDDDDNDDDDDDDDDDDNDDGDDEKNYSDDNDDEDKEDYRRQLLHKRHDDLAYSEK